MASKALPTQAPPKDREELSRAQAGPKRLTIAVLIDNANFFEVCYEANLREALDAKCRQDGHNLLLLYGGPLDAPGPTGAADNTIFKALMPGSFDGIIAVSSMLAALCGPCPVARLLESYRPTKLCSSGLALPGVPSLVLDNRGGMEAAVEHLVRDHGVRRPVFLAGTPNNPEAQARFDAYKNVLARHGIPFDPALVACGYFMPEQGRSAMDDLLAQGIAFDGVVSANDNMAIGAIGALRKGGRRVAREVLVAGFDDLPVGGLVSPPGTHPEDAALVSHRLIESLRVGSEWQHQAFQKTVGDLIEDMVDDSEHHHLLQDAIEWLHDELSDLSDIELERAFYEGLNLVATASTTAVGLAQGQVGAAEL